MSETPQAPKPVAETVFKTYDEWTRRVATTATVITIIAWVASAAFQKYREWFGLPSATLTLSIIFEYSVTLSLLAFRLRPVQSAIKSWKSANVQREAAVANPFIVRFSVESAIDVLSELFAIIVTSIGTSFAVTRLYFTFSLVNGFALIPWVVILLVSFVSLMGKLLAWVSLATYIIAIESQKIVHLRSQIEKPEHDAAADPELKP